MSIGFTTNAIALPTLAQEPVIYTDGKSLLKAARAEIERGRYQAAILLLKKAVTFFEIQGDLKNKGIAFNLLGNCHQRLKEYSQAINYHQQSLIISREIGDRLDEGLSLSNLGSAYSNLRKLSEAINYYQQSLRISREIGNRRSEGFSLNILGNFYSNLGKLSEAISYYQQSLKISREIGNLSLERRNLNNLGNSYSDLGKLSEAINYHQQSLRISRETGNHFDEGHSLNSLGNPYSKLGKYSEAINYFQQSLKISREIGNLSLEGISLNSLGDSYNKLGKLSEAINYHQQSLRISREIGDRFREGRSLNSLGNSYSKLGKYSEAINYFQQSLKISREISYRFLEKASLDNLGIICQDLGKYSEAINYFQQSTNINDSLRLNLKDEDKISLLQTQISSYKFLAISLALNKNLPESLVAIDRGRARAFADLLSQRIEANPTTTKYNLLNFAQIQAQAIDRQATIISYSLIPNSFVTRDRRKSNRLLIHVISPTGKLTVRQIDIPRDSELKQLVDGNRTELLASRSSGLTIDKFKPNMLVRLNGDEPDTKRRVIRINRQRQTIALQGIGQNNRETEEVEVKDIAGLSLPKERPELRQLHQLLIAPIADLLPTNPQSPVIFIPDGTLYEVPFAALKNERGQYLIDLHPISIAPSLSVLAQTAKLKQRNIPKNSPSLVVGNPDFSQLKQRYEQLKFSGDEARAVSKLFPSRLLLGGAATESAVKQSLPSARIAHFATHGIRDGENGLNSGIILTPSGNDSGILTAEKILDLKLNADLVVLSACDTGRGKITGDGVIGLSRSFIAAGANSIIVSLWSVDDKATAMLMTDFYRQWRGGKNKAQALRAAMLNTKAKYPDPYYWSSMSLYGEID